MGQAGFRKQLGPLNLIPAAIIGPARTAVASATRWPAFGDMAATTMGSAGRNGRLWARTPIRRAYLNDMNRAASLQLKAVFESSA